MTSYAAINVNKDTVVSILANVVDVPAGTERLLWAMLKYPYQEGTRYYYIGGNYLNMSQPNFMRQFLTQEELDELFDYTAKKKVNGKPNPDLNWFVVKLKDKVSTRHPNLKNQSQPAEAGVGLCSGSCLS